MTQQNEESSYSQQNVKINFKIQNEYDEEMELLELCELKNEFQNHFSAQLISMNIFIQSMEETKKTPKQQYRQLIRKLKLRKAHRNAKIQVQKTEINCETLQNQEHDRIDDFKQNQVSSPYSYCRIDEGEWQEDFQTQQEQTTIPQVQGMLDQDNQQQEKQNQIVNKVFLNELSLSSLSSLHSLAL